MKPRISFLPSYSVLALQKVVPSGTDVGAACIAVCEELLKVSKNVNMPLSAIADVYGMVMLHSDWERKDTSFLLMEECIVLPWEEFNMKKFSSLQKLSDRETTYYVKSSPAGMYAIVPYKGDYIEVEKIYEQMFFKWLPKSKYRYAGGPVLEIYKNNHQKKKKKIMDVCFPIQYKGKQIFTNAIGEKVIHL